MRGKRVAGGALAALLVGVLVWLALRPAPVQVEVAEVRRGPLEVTVDEEGRTRVRDRFVVSAPVAGELQRVELDPGDPVERGEPVATLLPAPPTPLDPRTRAELEQRLRAAEASVRSARAARGFAAAERERQERLAARGAVARRALEEAQLRDEATARQVEEAEAIAAALRAQLGTAGGAAGGPIQLRAPARGRVLRVLQESEAVVAPGTPILEIGDAHDLEIVTDVLSEEAVAIRPEAPVRIERWGGDRVLRGQVRRVEPSAYTKVSALGVEEQRVDVIIDLLDPPELRQGLGDGYRVVTRIVTWSTDDAVIAPLGALFRQGGRWNVFVVRDGRARAQPVEVGRRGDDAVQILEGLSPGDRVVLYPGDRLEDGARVEVARGT